MSVATATEPAPFRERIVGLHDADAPGPTLVIVGGVHGNEPAGLHAAERTLARLREQRPLSMRGRVVALAGNLSALNAETGEPDHRPRFLERDLNRCFRPEIIDSVRNTEDALLSVEEMELRSFVDAFDEQIRLARGPVIVLDLHTVSAPSPPFAGVEDSIPARTFARRFGLPIILGLEEELNGLLMDWTTSARGCVSMVVEGGAHDDPRSIDVLEAVIRIAMDAAGILTLADDADRHDPRALLREAAGERAGRVYDVRHREGVRAPDFLVKASLRAFDRVRAGDVIGSERRRPIVAPTSGLLFMPNRQRVRRIGDDAYFLVRHVGWAWLWLSARLRRRWWIHGALPRVLPGVRTRTGHPNDLLVAPEIAAVLKREIFHLLGYRLIRHGDHVHLPAWKRTASGAWHALRATGAMLIGLVRGGEPAALPEERPEDWIVARRTLDVQDPSPPRRNT